MMIITLLVATIMLSIRAVLAADCHMTDISRHHLASSFEPSDIIWDKYTQVSLPYILLPPSSYSNIKLKRLWVVSDGGDLASMTYDGSSLTYWAFKDKPDLEGIVRIPGREEYPIHIYLFK